MQGVDHLLRGVPGVIALAGESELVTAIATRLDELDKAVADRERALDDLEDLDAELLERANAELIDLKDALWAVRHDRLRTVRAVEALAGRDAGAAALAGYLAVQQALSAIDRLEVRGRDSAGIHLFVWDHALDADVVDALVAARGRDPLFQSGSVEVADGCLSFVYKAAAEIGELGDNTAVLRTATRADGLPSARRSSASASIAARRTAVLSPSSPISAAAV